MSCLILWAVLLYSYMRRGVFFRIALLWSMEMEFIVWWFTTDVSFSIRVFQRCHFLQARSPIIPCEIGRCKFLLNIHINYHFFLFFVWHVERNKIKQTQKICWRCCNSDLSWMKYANEKKNASSPTYFRNRGSNKLTDSSEQKSQINKNAGRKKKQWRKWGKNEWT